MCSKIFGEISLSDKIINFSSAVRQYYLHKLSAECAVLSLLHPQLRACFVHLKKCLLQYLPMFQLYNVTIGDVRSSKLPGRGRFFSDSNEEFWNRVWQIFGYSNIFRYEYSFVSYSYYIFDANMFRYLFVLFF